MPKENRKKDEPLMQFMSQYRPIYIFGGGFVLGWMFGLVTGMAT